MVINNIRRGKGLCHEPGRFVIESSREKRNNEQRSCHYQDSGSDWQTTGNPEFLPVNKMNVRRQRKKLKPKTIEKEQKQLRGLQGNS